MLAAAFGLVWAFSLLTCAHSAQSENQAVTPNLNRDFEGGILSAIFVPEKSRYLNVSPIAVASVYCALECSQLCLPITECFSFNLASSSEGAGKRECQLLSTDKFNSSEQLEVNQEYDHYSIKVRRNGANQADNIICGLIFFLPFSSYLRSRTLKL